LRKCSKRSGMLTNLNTFVPFASLLLTVVLAVGGVFAFRGAINRSASEIQKNSIEALQAQNEAQEVQIKTLEKEMVRLKKQFETVQIALKHRGLSIEMEGDSIILIDNQTRQTRTVISIDAKDAHDKEV
jgi:hypothetical protein